MFKIACWLSSHGHPLLARPFWAVWARRLKPTVRRRRVKRA